MLLTGVREWFKPRASAPPYSATQAATAALSPALADQRALWPPARIELAGQLWGSGYVLPGGETELLRVATPLGLSDATSLLLLGCGPGGAARSIVNHLGAWVTGFEADPDLAAAANLLHLQSGLGRRAEIELWDPAAPRFQHRSFHNALALDPIRGELAEPVLGALALALRFGGQIVLVQIVAGTQFDPADPAIRAWSRLERRTPALPSEHMITQILGGLGYEVCITEDISRRHIRLAVRGWGDALRSMRDKRSSPSAVLTREAELWLHRVNLLRSGALRLIRWHAIHRAPA